MGSNISVSKRITIIGYSTIFIVVSYFLLLKSSPVFFNIFSFFPLLLIGSILNLRLTLLSFFISGLIIFSIFFTIIENSNFNLDYLLSNIFLTFFLSFLFIYLIKFKKSSFGDILTRYTLCSSSILIYIFIFTFSDQMYAIFEEIKNQYKSIFSEKSKINESDLDNLFNSINTIFPAINFIIHLSTILFNYYISTVILRKYNFVTNPTINFKKFEQENWLLYLLIFLIFTALTSNNNLHLFSLNLCISISFIFFVKGLEIFYLYLNRFNKERLFKNVLVFFIFIFFGYFLIFSLFFVGVMDKLKKIFKKVQ